MTQDQIVGRITNSLVPFSGSPLFENGKEDLYGPLWVFITLNISIAIFGYLCVSIDKMFEDQEIEYKMEASKIVKGYSLLMFYFVVIPLGLFLLLKLIYPENPSYQKILAVYGYSFTIFIPTTFTFLIPIEVIRWLFLIIAGIVSLWILFKEMVMNGLEYLEESKIYMIAGLQGILHIIFI